MVEPQYVSWFGIQAVNNYQIIRLAYDLKLMIDKGKYDVVRPSWVEDSITLGRCAPFRKK